MEIFSKYNRKNIQDRQVDTLIGLSKGLIADGQVVKAEAEFLQSWLIQNRGSSNPVILNLLEKISVMLEDGILDEEESQELLSVLRKVSGEHSEIGELAKTSSLPVNNPMPEIEFSGKLFLFTGTFAYGNRKSCEQLIESLGGINSGGVTKKLNYLILGTYVTDSWAHENFGRKIESAMEYRSSGVPLSIVTEEHWLKQAGM